MGPLTLWERTTLVLGCCALVATVRAHSVAAEEKVPAQAATPTEPAKPGTEVRGWLDPWRYLNGYLKEATGTTVSLYVDTQAQFALHGPGEGHERPVFWWNLKITQDLWRGAKLITNTRGGSGNGLDPILGDRASTNWEAGEPRFVYISDVYVEQKLLDDRLTLAFGKFDVTDYFDKNEIASWNMLSYSLARNPTIPFAYHAIAGAARYEPCEWLYVQAAAADAEGSSTESGLNTAFRHGEPYVRIGELGFRPALGGRPGTYRLLAWHDPRTRAEINGPGRQHGDAGLGLNFDQQLTDKFGVFFRYGFADEKVRRTEHFWAAGGKWTGPVPQRERDELVVGLAQHVLGEDFRRANHSTRTETLLEAYYRIRVTPSLSVSPDLQVIWSPGAERGKDTAIVGGLRLQLAF